MRKPQKWILLVLAVAIICVVTPAQPAFQGKVAESRGILYRAEKDGKTAYLLGSIHIGNQLMYPFGQDIQDAMEASDVFVLECDTASGQAIKDTLDIMYYKDQTRLSDVIPKETYQKLERVCQQESQPLTLYALMKPWVVMNNLSYIATARAIGFEGEDSFAQAYTYGVETAVRAFATEHGKPLEYLEETKAQLDMLDSFSLPLQIMLLEQTLDTILDPSQAVGADASVADWPTWWAQGDRERFAAIYAPEALPEVVDDPDYQILMEEYLQKLVTQRNIGMADRLEAMMAEGDADAYFVTVGLLHLVLPGDSVAEHLQEKGFTVECLSDRDLDEAEQ